MEVIRGTIYKLGDMVQVTEKFAKREFVVQEDLVTKFGAFTSHYAIQATNKNIPKLDGFREGQSVTVTVIVNGRKYNRKDNGQEAFSVSLDLYKIEGDKSFNNSGNQVMIDHPAGVTPAMAQGGVIKPSSLAGLGQPVQAINIDEVIEEDDLPF